MFLFELEKYNSQYEKGIKKISFRSSCPRIVKEPFDLKLEKSHGNYDLFFNSKGLLLHSVHTEKNKNFKMIYGYNRKGILIAVMGLLSEKNELISHSEFEYDEKGRIESETVRSFSNLDWIEKTEYIHSYNDNTEVVFRTSDNEEEEDGTFYYTYDDKKRIIEEKAIRGEDEFVYWNKNEYDEDNNMIRETSFDEYGDNIGVCEFIPAKNGLSNGYYCKSKDGSYLREFLFNLNDKGHWINQVMLFDGEPRYFFDRTIEYY